MYLLYSKVSTLLVQSPLLHVFSIQICQLSILTGSLCGHSCFYGLILSVFQVTIFYEIIIIQQAAQCVHIFLRSFINYIIFFLQLCLSFQSSSTNPFSPISHLT
jgi:hypothetical protein